MLHAQLENMTPWTRTVMATSGIKSSTPGMSSFSASENSFSSKNILNLMDETMEKQKGISKYVASIYVLDAPCSPPPSLVRRSLQSSTVQ